MGNNICIPIPKQSVDAYKKHKDKQYQNPGLIFDRFIRYLGTESKDEKSSRGNKKEELEKVREAAEKIDDELLKAWNARWEASVRSAGAVSFEMKTHWRFVTGLGRKGPLEIGFTFHRYGFPILPGSSVKGIARAYASQFEGKNENDEDFRTIFGCAPQGGEDETDALCGGAIFFDAIPSREPKLDIDIMNPHFPEYYQGKKAPTDCQNPVPIYFLTVAPGTEFRFAVGWRGTLDEKTEKLLNKAVEWLKCGLMELGAGAKTSAGYGYFIETHPTQDASKSTAAASAQRTPAESDENALVERILNISLPQIKSTIKNYFDKWDRLPDGPGKLKVARALKDQMEKASILKDKKWSGKDWVLKVREYLEAHENSEDVG